MHAKRIEELKKAFLAEPIANISVPFSFELLELAHGYAEVKMKVTEGMLVGGGVGVVNGGIMDTLANTAGVYAAMSRIPAGHTLRMNYSARNLRETRAGEILLATAEVVEENKTSFVVDFQVTNLDAPEDVKAAGQAQYHKPRPKE
ncbi:MAG: hotdog domain-containing protein [Candidatus Liptonbacteria bacterium]|nr:hotdog domain-containing protein [Candidatus Liptonbacteria bacterium]